MIHTAARFLVLAVFLPLFACSDSPEDAADGALTSDAGILRYVPADTPYIFAALEPVPEDVSEKMRPQIETVVQSYRALAKAAVTHAPADPDGATISAEEMKARAALIDKVASLVTADGIPEAGIDRNSTAAFYGVGLLPVLRVTSSNGELLEKTLAKIEADAATKMAVATVGGQSYRYAGNDQARTIIAVIGNQLVVSVVPVDLQEDLLKSVLGLTLPETSIADSGELVALAEKYGFKAHWLGQIDFQRIVNTFLDDQSGINGELLTVMDYDASTLTDVCKAEIRSMVGIVPRFVTGYTDISTEEFKSNSVFEMRSDLATGLQALTAPVPGLGAKHGGLLSFGMSLNLGAARDFYAAQLDALEADPYECELFADLQASVASGRAMLNQPVPPIVYGFRGFLAVIDDIKGMDIAKKQPPTDIEARLLVATDNAEGLLAMGAMFSPEIAALDLKPDAKPVKFDLPVQAANFGAAYVAMSENALALSFGAGSEAALTELLSADPSTPSPFVSMDMDSARYYGLIGDASMSADTEGATSPEMTKAMGDVMHALEEMFSRISFDVQFTGRGVEVPTTITLKE